MYPACGAAKPLIDPKQHSCADFGRYKIRPTHYTFAHRAGREVGYYPRNWELHASADGQNWEGVIRHNNDTSLCAEKHVASWPVNRRTDFYSQFRVALDPKGNSWGTSALVVSCFEVYGDWYFEDAK